MDVRVRRCSHFEKALLAPQTLLQPHHTARLRPTPFYSLQEPARPHLRFIPLHTIQSQHPWRPLCNLTRSIQRSPQAISVVTASLLFALEYLSILLPHKPRNYKETQGSFSTGISTTDPPRTQNPREQRCGTKLEGKGPYGRNSGYDQYP